MIHTKPVISFGEALTKLWNELLFLDQPLKIQEEDGKSTEPDQTDS